MGEERKVHEEEKEKAKDEENRRKKQFSTVRKDYARKLRRQLRLPMLVGIRRNEKSEVKIRKQ